MYSNMNYLIVFPLRFGRDFVLRVALDLDDPAAFVLSAGVFLETTLFVPLYKDPSGSFTG